MPSTAPPLPDPSTDTYTANNQIQTVDAGQLPAPTYDASGDVTQDSQGQQYLYDAEGRICAATGLGGMFEYLYDGVPVDRSASTGRDADGTRITKGTITTNLLKGFVSGHGFIRAVKAANKHRALAPEGCLLRCKVNYEATHNSLPCDTSSNGFTLMELLMVILILPLMAIPTFGGIKKHANETSAIVSMQTIEAAELIQADLASGPLTR